MVYPFVAANDWFLELAGWLGNDINVYQLIQIGVGGLPGSSFNSKNEYLGIFIICMFIAHFVPFIIKLSFP